MEWLRIKGPSGCVPLTGVPTLPYGDFYGELCALLSDGACHIVHYFAIAEGDGLRFYALVADDASGQVLVASHVASGYYGDISLESVTAGHLAAHPFEREMAELYGVRFEGHPWPKPLRHPYDRVDQRATLDNYPFFTIDSDALHEVNVGPIHAGIIEPGAFRFVCNGEKVLHLEIALGYQHRGVETLLRTASPLKRANLCDSIAGDTAAGHSFAHAMLMETATGIDGGLKIELDLQRTIALELERVAMHIGDTGALCMDVGYQLGQVACEALRTIAINTSQLWCGNRFSKSFVRPFGTRYPLTGELVAAIGANCLELKKRYAEVAADILTAPSVLARFEDTCPIGRETLLRIGAVGMAARAGGVARDIRRSHPFGAFAGHEPVLGREGDVFARMELRLREAAQSLDLILELLEELRSDALPQLPAPEYDYRLPARSLAFALCEGWRGEICHAVLTGEHGEVAAYKVKDPSVHNWLALALAVRGAEISDFPVCNKSFNLSYCGHDL